MSDRSGLRRDCLINGSKTTTMFVPGKRGEAFALSGERWLECPQPPVSADAPRALTVSMWVKLRSFPDFHAAFATRQLGWHYEDQFFFGLERDQVRVSSHAWQGFFRTRARIDLERWFHAAYVHDEAGFTRAYIDGAEVGRATGAHVGRGQVTSSLTIGAGHFSPNPRRVRNHLDGAIDEVRFYDRALSPQEINELATNAPSD